MSKLIDGKNYFNETSLNEMCAALESGEAIRIYIDCIGHTRDTMETANYVEALKKKYGDKLQIDTKSDFTPIYMLK